MSNEIRNNLSNLPIGASSGGHSKKEALEDLPLGPSSATKLPLKGEQRENTEVQLTPTVGLLKTLEDNLKNLPAVDVNRVTAIRSKLQAGALDFQSPDKRQEAAVRIAERLLALDSQLPFPKEVLNE